MVLHARSAGHLAMQPAVESAVEHSQTQETHAPKCRLQQAVLVSAASFAVRVAPAFEQRNRQELASRSKICTNQGSLCLESNKRSTSCVTHAQREPRSSGQRVVELCWPSLGLSPFTSEPWVCYRFSSNFHPLVPTRNLGERVLFEARPRLYQFRFVRFKNHFASLPNSFRYQTYILADFPFLSKLLNVRLTKRSVYFQYVANYEASWFVTVLLDNLQNLSDCDGDNLNCVTLEMNWFLLLKNIC